MVYANLIVATGENRDYVRVLLFSYYTTITGWGVLLRNQYLRSRYFSACAAHAPTHLSPGAGHYAKSCRSTCGGNACHACFRAVLDVLYRASLRRVPYMSVLNWFTHRLS